MGDLGIRGAWSWASFARHAQCARFRRGFVHYSSLAGTRIPQMRFFVQSAEASRSHPLDVSIIFLSSRYLLLKIRPSDVNSAIGPYSYRGGRWLNRDNVERKSRQFQSDFAALCTRAVEVCPRAKMRRKMGDLTGSLRSL